MTNVSVGFYKLFEDVEIPERSTEGSACLDIKAYLKNGCKLIRGTMEDVSDLTKRFTKESVVMIPTGIIADIPEGYSVRIHPRSSCFKRGYWLANQEGIVDWDYVDQIFIAIYCFKDVDINHGERIAQIEIVPTYNIEPVEIFERPTQKTNRNGGFGSTGE